MQREVSLQDLERSAPPPQRAGGRGDDLRPAPSAPLKIISPTSWQNQEVPEREWIIDGIIPRGTVVMLSGDGGTGKSLLTLQLSVCLALGRQFLALPVIPCKVFGVYCEDEPEEIHRRLADIVRHHDVDFQHLENFSFISRVGMNTEFLQRNQYGKAVGPSQFYKDVRRAAKESGARLVILDGLHDLFDGNENSRPEARQFVNMLRTIALEIDGAVVLCAHPSVAGMSSGTGSAGSTAWNNAVRSRVYFTRVKDSDGKEEDVDARVLKTMKTNYGKVGGEIKLRYQGGVFVIDSPESGTVANIQKQKQEQEAEEAFLHCLLSVTKQGRSVSDARNSARFAPKVFSVMKESRGVGQKALSAAMDRLFSTSRIQIGNTPGPDRHPIKTIVPVPLLPPPE